MRVLSIDFDAIMFPCIRLYNENCAGKESDTQIWNMLESRYDIQNFLSYDANLYKDIFKLVIKNIQDGATFVPIKEHDELITYLKDNNQIMNDMQVVNLDFHHDIMYHRESLSQILDFDKWSCADWLGYLLLKNENNTGIWIRCPGSDGYHSESTGKDFDEKFIVKNLKDLPDILDEQFDIVFLCLSPQWVPHCYHHLYNTIVEIANIVSTSLTNTNIDNNNSNIISFPPPTLLSIEGDANQDD